jgi:transcriptional regulator with XRE-family HTH domain
MPRSLRVRHDCIAKVKLAVTDNGYPNQRVLARHTGLSLSTISNFLTGKPVSYASFEQICRILNEQICRILNLDWPEISTNTEQQKYELCDLCDNNPLKIKIVVNAIIKLFNGDIDKYLTHTAS